MLHNINLPPKLSKENNNSSSKVLQNARLQNSQQLRDHFDACPVPALQQENKTGRSSGLCNQWKFSNKGSALQTQTSFQNPHTKPCKVLKLVFRRSKKEQIYASFKIAVKRIAQLKQKENHITSQLSLKHLTFNK